MIDFGLYDKPIITDVVDAALQELDLLFSTENTELIGDSNFGMNFYRFLWELVPAESTLEKYIKEKIEAYTYYVRNMKYDLYVENIQDISENIYVVHISLYVDENTTKDRTYVINK